MYKRQVIDKPGNLSKLLKLISDSGANVVNVDHNRYATGLLNGFCEVRLIIETTSEVHILKLLESLTLNGFQAKVVSK